MSQSIEPSSNAAVGAGVQPPQPVPAAASPHGSSAVLWGFTATTFLSALLLFSLQPMFAKMVLPVLGGAPSVWAVAMCFFQGALLAGYCYAHVLIRKLPPARTGLIHLALTVLAVLSAIPSWMPRGFVEPPAGEPYLWQLGLFAVGIGLPFVAVSANAPLLQAWFAATGHPHGRDPYFLYAASNLGSLLALLSYPLLLEPAFGVRALSEIWTAGFALLCLCLAGCFMAVRRAAVAAGIGTTAAPGTEEVDDIASPTAAQRLGWVGLALVPSALLTAFTTHVTTDIASAPLLWVLPLALYLLTFVLVFREHSLIPRPILLVLHLAAVVVALLQLSQTRLDTWFVSSGAGVAVFFTSAMVAHRTLYEARPAARHLTEFYLWMSLGGVLGGLFAALIAPKLFSEVFEYPLLLALSMACRPGAARLFVQMGAAAVGGSRAIGLPVPAGWPGLAKGQGEDLLRAWLLLALGLLAIFWVPMLASHFDWHFGNWGTTAALSVVFAAVLLAAYRSPPLQLIAALLMFLAVVMLPSAVKKGEASRSYFGVYRVLLSNDGEFNILMHGTTLHGAQRVRDSEGKPVADATPGTYYHPASPMANSVTAVREAVKGAGKRGRYGVIGLGTGSLACLAEEDEDWRIFEIDPVIIGIARDSKSFTFLANCLPDPDIVIGDARLTMAKEKDASFDLIIVDAFSSDAVPVHLMTREALEIYRDKISDIGVAVLHISNRYLDLERVLAATVKEVPGLKGVVVSDDEADGSYASTTSTVVVVAKSDAALQAFRQMDGFREFGDSGKQRAWTDDYSDVLGPFMSKLGRKD